ncbi:hypothetical protein BH10PSE2_BH10PSE2_02330 [soil metagenome]
MLTLISLALLIAGQSRPVQSQPVPPAPPPGGPEIHRVMVLGGLDVGGPRPPSLDKDGDGFVTRDEFNGPTNDAFRILDRDADGRISVVEFEAGRAAAHVILGGPAGPGGPHPMGGLHGPMGPMGGMASMAGEEGMHGMGPAELHMMRSGPGAGPDPLDTDHDGKVTEAEFLAPLRTLFQQMDADHSGALDAGEHGDGAEVRVIAQMARTPDR